MRELIRLLVLVVLVIVILNAITFSAGTTEIGGILTLLIVIIVIAFVLRGRRL